MNYWLMKSEPDSFSIDDLARLPKQTTAWDGVRNYQARNLMQKMRQGEKVLFYHSSCDPPSVAGIATVAREAYPDSSAWTKGDDHFDPKASPENPIWQRVDIKLEKIFPRAVPLDELRGVKSLAKMVLLQRGSRLSVQPVTAAEFETIVKLAQSGPAKPQAAKETAAKKKTPGKKLPRKKK